MTFRLPVGPTAMRETVANEILAGLLAVEHDRFRSHLRPVPLRQKQVLHELGAPFHSLYFIESVASVVAVVNDGRTVEVPTHS